MADPQRGRLFWLLFALLAMTAIPVLACALFGASIQDTVVFGVWVELLVMGAALARARDELSPAMTRALLFLGLTGFCTYITRALNDVVASTASYKWFELSRAACTEEHMSSVWGLLWLFLCPLAFVVDLFMTVVQVVRLLAMVGAPLFMIAGFASLSVALHAFYREYRARKK